MLTSSLCLWDTLRPCCFSSSAWPEMRRSQVPRCNLTSVYINYLERAGDVADTDRIILGIASKTRIILRLSIATIPLRSYRLKCEACLAYKTVRLMSGRILTPEEYNTRGTLVSGLTYRDVQSIDIFEGTVSHPSLWTNWPQIAD